MSRIATQPFYFRHTDWLPVVNGKGLVSKHVCFELDIFWMLKEVLSIYRKIVVLWNKHWCFETAGQIYFMNYVIILGKKIIFVTELYKYSDENIQVSRFLYIVNIFLM